MSKKVLCMLVFIGVLNFAAIGLAEEIYYYLPLKDLKITDGHLPHSQPKDLSSWEMNPQRRRNLEGFMQPYAVCHGEGEIYLSFEGRRRWLPSASLPSNMATIYIAVRAPREEEVSGRLFIPKPDWSGMTYVDFVAPTAAADQKTARLRFLEAKEQHYQSLLARDIPGSAWFRHQVRETRLARGDTIDDNETNTNIPQFQVTGRGNSSQLQRTYSFFSGGRAISENLQLDRRLLVVPSDNMSVPINSIEGITIGEIDWRSYVQGLEPQKDILAQYIPADQHVLFFPSFQAMLDLMDEADTRGTPILNVVEPRSEDAQTRERYHRQLCLTPDLWSRLLGPKLIATVAFTGSDPYLRTGSDVAVLFEALKPKALSMAISGRQSAALSKVSGATSVSGRIRDVDYEGVISPDRSICSYMILMNNVVIVSNSLYQLEQIILASMKQIPTIASLDEYTFFRDRYKIGDPDETALLIVTDPTIRRWCSPRWRITDSRRTRAAAAMAELQARYLENLAADEKLEPLDEGFISGLGELSVTSKGVTSSIYGTLEFLTPIAEIPIDNVTPEEAQAYNWFRQNYQGNWRRFFDPIAVRFSLRSGQVAADLTVRPLIAASQYREFIDLTGDLKIAPNAGDPHAKAMIHYVMALDVESELMRRVGNLGMQMLSGLEINVLDWIGQWATLYLDEDLFWKELERANARGGGKAMEDFMEKHFTRLPVALEIDVDSPFKLTAFLTVLRAFIEQTVPRMTAWESLTHEDQSYVRVAISSDSGGMSEERGAENYVLYYAATPTSLILTPSERVLKAALDRATARQKAKAKGEKLPPPSSDPWLGKSVSFQAKKSAFAVLDTLFGDDWNLTLERRAWENIFILNEWRRHWGHPQPVEFHQRFWHTKLICPGGGEYVWNEEFQTMESTVFGHPGAPRESYHLSNPLSEIAGVNLGITFEGDGLRAKAEIKETPN